MNTTPPFEPPPWKIFTREAMIRWHAHRVKDVPNGCMKGSTFGEAYLTNLRDWGEKTTWGDAWGKSILVIGGGPSGIRAVEKIMTHRHDVVLMTRDHLRESWRQIKAYNPYGFVVVDGEIDMLCCVRDYPKDYDRSLICDPCKLLDPRIPFSAVHFVNLVPMFRYDDFPRPKWLGPVIPYRTSGELALYLALYVFRAKEVAVLGVENAEPERKREYDHAMEMLRGDHSSEVIDFSGRGVVADYIRGKM